MSDDEPSGEPIDGRSARRERGRLAVIDAVFELIEEGHVPPDVNDLAERSGVSVASIFRYFDGLQDIQIQTMGRFHDRFRHLFLVEGIADASLNQRIEAYVDTRLDMLVEVGSVVALARLRAMENEEFDEAYTAIRELLSEQVHHLFAPETAAMGPESQASFVAIVDSLASPQAWDVMRLSHGRTPQQIRVAWITTLRAIVQASSPTTFADLSKD